MAQSRVGSSGNKVLAELSQDPTARKNKHDELRRKFDALERHADFLETRLKATEKSGNQGAYNAILQQLQNAETRINNLATEMNSIAESDRYSKEQERKRQKIPDSKPKTMMDSVRESLPYQIGSGIRDMIVDTGKGIGQTALYGENAIRGSTLGKNDKGFTTLQFGKAGTQLNPNTMQMEDIQFGDVADVYAKELGKNTGTYIDALNSMMHWRQGRLKPDSQDERFRKMIGDVVPRIFGTKDIKDPTVAKGAEVIADPLAVLGGAVKGAKVTAKAIDEFGDIARGIRTADGQYIPRNQLGAIENLFHGSPHTFDRFDLSKIGTGEGAQAYGHGAYLAESPDVANSYMRAGKNVGFLNWDTVSEIASKATAQAKGDKTIALKIIDDEIAKTNGQSKKNNLRFAKKAIERGDVQGANLYQTRLAWPDDAREATNPLSPEHFIDWDKPLSQQSAQVKKAISSMGKDDEWKFMVREAKREGMTVGEFYDFIAGDESGYSFGSEILSNYGIPGIRYLDAGSRGAGEGSRNYVVFDDKLIDIVERNGVPIKKAKK
jgi:hypothetical protein